MASMALSSKGVMCWSLWKLWEEGSPREATGSGGVGPRVRNPALAWPWRPQWGCSGFLSLTSYPDHLSGPPSADIQGDPGMGSCSDLRRS